MEVDPSMTSSSSWASWPPDR